MTNPMDRFRYRVWDNDRKSFDDGSFYYIGQCAGELCLIDWKENRHDIGDRFVIQQCTGQKDVTGKLIFEGDILQYAPGVHIIVKWQDSQHDLSYWICEGVEYGSCTPWSYVRLSKVVGNIFELVNS